MSDTLRRELSEQEIEFYALQMKLEALEQSMESMQSLDDELTSSRRTSFGTVNDCRNLHKLREGGLDTTDIVDLHFYLKQHGINYPG